MDYKEAMAFLEETYKFGSKMGLERIERLMEMLGNPHRALKYVHVAGTNGKGSTTTYISSILINAGYRTGIFTSPYIQRFSERIKINHGEITEEEIAGYMTEIKEKIDILVEEDFPHPTEFEILTAMAILHYYRNQCDVVVLEVGLGGIVDSTNIIEDSLVSVICTIGFDHMQYLGDTLEEIAEKKAGIIKEGGSVVVYPQEERVMAVFERVCREKNAVLHKVDPEEIEYISGDIHEQEFNCENYSNLKITLLGRHQVYNAALAVKAVKVLIEQGYKITVPHVKSGLVKAKWPGRLEVVSQKPCVIIDGAHNTEAAENLAATLKELFPGKKLTFIVGVMKDKEYEKMFAPFVEIAYRFFCIQPNVDRALPLEELVHHLSRLHDDVEGFDSVDDAITFAMNTTPGDEVICAFGSLYYIGEIRDYFHIK